MQMVMTLAGLLMIEVAADYPQFRGPAGNGVATANPPTTWKAGQSVAWRTPLPGTGWSQPVVMGSTVFVTAAVCDQLRKPKDMEAGVKDLSSMPLFAPKAPNATIKWQVMALDADTGAVQWTTTVADGKPKQPIHPSNTYATETPCADSKRVYAYFGATGTVAALDHSGKVVWKTELGSYPISAGFGTGSSPLLLDGRLFLNFFNEENAFVVALDAKTGAELWRKRRDKPGSSWASPFAWRNSKRTEVVACGDKLVTSHDPATGAENWRLGGIGTGFAPSPAADGDLLVFGAASPFSPAQTFAVKAGASGNITLKKDERSSESVAWTKKGGVVGMASPVAAAGLVYWTNQGIIACYEAATGKQVYKERLASGRMVTASPLLVGDRLLIVSETGKAQWIKAGRKFEVVGSGELDDTFWASPAVAGDRLFLRGVDALYCLKR